MKIDNILKACSVITLLLSYMTMMFSDKTFASLALFLTSFCFISILVMRYENKLLACFTEGVKTNKFSNNRKITTSKITIQ